MFYRWAWFRTKRTKKSQKIRKKRNSIYFRRKELFSVANQKGVNLPACDCEQFLQQNRKFDGLENGIIGNVPTRVFSFVVSNALLSVSLHNWPQTLAFFHSFFLSISLSLSLSLHISISILFSLLLSLFLCLLFPLSR